MRKTFNVTGANGNFTETFCERDVDTLVALGFVRLERVVHTSGIWTAYYVPVVHSE